MSAGGEGREEGRRYVLCRVGVGQPQRGMSKAVCNAAPPLPGLPRPCRGLHALIRPEWVSMFNEEELQMLISGGQQGLDIADMRAHVEYAGGYHNEHPVMQVGIAGAARTGSVGQGDGGGKRREKDLVV